MPKFTGIVYINLGSVGRLRSKEGAKLNLGGMERTPQMANGEVVGYSEKPVAATVECTVLHGADTDLEAIRAFVDGTLTFETDTGVTYLLANAFCTEPPELSDDGGGASCKFAGKAAVSA